MKTAEDDSTTHAKHRYHHTRRGRPSVCVRCGVKRRSAKDRSGRSGRWRRAVDERVGRWQYQAPCQRDTWQHRPLPCAVVGGVSVKVAEGDQVNDSVCCKDGHTFTIRSVRGHAEWHCVVCYYLPSAYSLLAAFVEKHGGRIVP